VRKFLALLGVVVLALTYHQLIGNSAPAP